MKPPERIPALERLAEDFGEIMATSLLSDLPEVVLAIDVALGVKWLRYNLHTVAPCFQFYRTAQPRSSFGDLVKLDYII